VGTPVSIFLCGERIVDQSLTQLESIVNVLALAIGVLARSFKQGRPWEQKSMM